MGVKRPEPIWRAPAPGPRRSADELDAALDTLIEALARAAAQSDHAKVELRGAT